MEFEDILLEVGDYGKYQRDLILYFLVPGASLLPWFTMNVLFMVSVPDHWCHVPEVAASNLTIEQQRALISPPQDPKCRMYDINYTEFMASGMYTVPNDTTTRPCNNGWQFDQTYYDSTTATQWDMVCSDDHYTSLVLTLYNVGSIIGTPIYGSLSDKIGRKIVFFITIVVTAATAISSVLMTNFTAFVVIKTINGSLMPSIFQLPYIIILEIVGPEMRTRMNGIVNCSWTFGLCFLPLIAYLSRSWVTLGLITSSVTLIFFLYWTFLPESPRWLVSQKRYEEAATIMQRIGQKNGKPQDLDSLINKLQKLGEKMIKEKEMDGVKNSSGDLLKYPQLRKKFFIITTCWMANIMAYYGLQINVANLAGNEFINFFLLSLVEVPGYLVCWVAMNRCGRRWCTVTGFIFTGIICMLPSVEIPYGDVACSMVGKFFAAGTFMATYQQSSELYPTVVRSLGMGMSSTIAFVATLIVPYLVYLSVYGKAIPFIIIGMSCLIAGVCAAFLPETLNENLPQTIFDAEEFGKNQKFFSWNRRRRSLSRERAASLAMKTKELDGKDEKELNSKNSQQIKNTLCELPLQSNNHVAEENMLNGKSNILRKRNNSESVSKDYNNANHKEKNSVNAGTATDNEEQLSDATSTPTYEQNAATKSSDHSPEERAADNKCCQKEEETKTYVNQVFEDDNGVEYQNKNNKESFKAFHDNSKGEILLNNSKDQETYNLENMV